MRQLQIFLNNKLISCDTILPLAMELAPRVPAGSIKFIVANHATFEVIRANRVLYDVMSSVGELISIGRRPGQNRLLHRLRVGFILAGLIGRAWLDRSVMLHFKALNNGVFRLLYKVRPERVFFCENDSYGFTQKMYDVTYYSVPDRPPVFRIPLASHLISFSADWPLLRAPEVRGRPVYRFGATRVRRIWLDHVRKSADAYFEAEFRRVGLPSSQEILVVMLGYFGQLGYMRSDQAVRERLRELLTVLLRHAGDRPIFMKPHPVTDLDILHEEIARLNDRRLIVSYLHPMVLAQRAALFASNYYTTTLGDAAMLGIPTIEYTDYADEALAITQGSMRPEFVSEFINGDIEELDRVVRSLLSKPKKQIPLGTESDPSGLLNTLADLVNGNHHH